MTNEISIGINSLKKEMTTNDYELLSNAKERYGARPGQ